MSANKGTDKPRRIHLKGHRGIYYTPLPGNRRKYEITYTDETGRQRWKTIHGDLEAAQAARAEILGQKREGHTVIPNRERFGPFAAEWMERQTHLSRSTRLGYGQILRRLSRFDNMLLKDIRADHAVEMLVDMRKRDLSNSVQIGTLSVLRMILEEAREKRIVPTNVAREIPKRYLPKHSAPKDVYLTLDEIGRLLGTPIDGLSEPAELRAKVLIATAIYSGLRISELLGLIWGDLDIADSDRAYIKVTHQLERHTKERIPRLKSKNGRRDVVLPRSLATKLKEYRLRVHAREDHDFVFSSVVGLAGKPMHHGDAAKAFQLAYTAAGISKPGLVFHSMRHTFASMLIDQGHDVLYVADQLGDSVPMVTKVYGHVFRRARVEREHRTRMESEYTSALDGIEMESTGSHGRLIAFPRQAS